MSPADLIQLIRTCNLAQVLAELEATKERKPEDYRALHLFYHRATKRKK